MRNARTISPRTSAKWDPSIGEPRPDWSGFTLTEVMIVVSILGLLLAASMPAMSRYMRSTRLTGTVRTLVADIHHTHSLATMQRKTYLIVFGTSEYAIVQADPPDTVQTRALPKGFVCAASDTATFFAWGLTAPAAITLTSGGLSRTVQLATNGGVTHD